MVAFECSATQADGSIPDYSTRRKIHKRVAKTVFQHFIIYTNADKNDTDLAVGQTRARENLSHAANSGMTAVIRVN